jgi:uncharacterized protein (DUF2345 family)
MAEETRLGQNESPQDPGPFLAKVVSHLDPNYMGALEVQLLHEVGNDEDREGQLRTVKYLSPFYGVSNSAYLGEDPDDYDNTQKSYGMWMVPPDIGTIVMVIFVGGDVRKGYWMGCVIEENMNFSLPGHASTKYVVDDTKETDAKYERVPTGEYNKIIHPVTEDPTKIVKPESPLATKLEAQGLLKDDIRGITSSSARREIPSSVFGISTPGPVDKTGKQGKVGKHEYKIPNAFVSRLGGSSFVMDDGDDKWERKTPASDGPPDYVSVEGGETAERDIPHNELVRIRTRTGHQILLHNSEDLIYIGNSRGTAWIELSSDGKIDIYAEDSVSLHTKQDLNFYADRDINIEAGRNLNIKVAEEMHTQVLGDQILIVDANQQIHVKGNVNETTDGSIKLTAGADYDINAGGHVFTTSGGSNETSAGGNIVETAPQIHMNGPGASSAASAELPTALKTHSLPDEEGNELAQSIMRRIPTHEPWPHHEHLDPEKFKPDQTDRDTESRNEGNTSTMNFTPEFWSEYTTATDTFEKIKGPEEQDADPYI